MCLYGMHHHMHYPDPVSYTHLARVAALRGHSVTIFEKSLQIGGQLLIASVPPRKEEMMRRDVYKRQVPLSRISKI